MAEDEGEILVVRTGTTGDRFLVDPGQCGTAVYLQSDRCVRLDNLPAALRVEYGLGRDAFVQVDGEDDETVFTSQAGIRISLSDLPEGQAVEVLCSGIACSTLTRHPELYGMVEIAV